MKTLYYNESFEQKSIIDGLEVSFTVAPIDATNTKVSPVDIDANSVEDITAEAKVSKINKSSDNMEIDLEEELKTENI